MRPTRRSMLWQLERSTPSSLASPTIPMSPGAWPYSESYFEAGPVLLARSDRRDIAGSRDLMGRTVAVELGSEGEEVAARLQTVEKAARLLPMDDVQRILESVASGRADAAILDRSSIPADFPDLALMHPVGHPLRTHPYMVAVRRSESGLLLAINRELEEMKATGTLSELERHWFP